MQHTSLWLAFLAALSPCSHAANDFLDDLSLEDLVKTEITSVSRKSQSLTDVAAAAFVITAEDIRRSGAQALPDVLRMAPGIEVAQIDNGRYAVTARGFNGRFANKLQVLIDGRSIYHPMFSGVVWELDPIPLDDIERIEIIRGAGAVMWGANAVNGVINIISKHSRNQTGNSASLTAGSNGSATLYARHGKSLEADGSWKVSFQGRYADASRQYEARKGAEDRLENAVVDLRLDRDLGTGRDLAIWANASHSATGDLWRVNPNLSVPGTLQLLPVSFTQQLHSESLVGRYRWLSDTGIESTLQLAGVRSGIEISDFIEESRSTVDLDYQGRFAVGQHDLLWGFGHRSSYDDVSATGNYISIRNPNYTHRTNGLFAQDDWTLVPERLKLGLGMRWDYASRNGNSFSPHATVLWTPSRSDSIWLKYARAPRTIARAEQDVSVLAGFTVMSLPPPFNILPIVQYATPNVGNLKPEKAEGVEIGYRKQFGAALSADISAYRYRYTKIRSGSETAMIGCSPLIAFVNPALPIDPARCPSLISGQFAILQQISATNGMSGWSDGLEVATEWLVMPSWRLQLSYTWHHLSIDDVSDPVMRGDALLTERSQPRHIASLRSQWNISSNHQLDLWVRGVSGFDRIDITDATPTTSTAPRFVRVPGYTTLDFRYAYRLRKDIEVALIGRNLLGNRRFEYLSDYIPSIANEIAASLLLNLRWKF